MITRKQIIKAAEDFANREYEISDIDRDPLYKGFYYGAKWRINSVWHDRTEQADTSKELMLMYSNRSCRITLLNLTWDGFLSVDMFIKWAFIEDLIPNKEDL